jgi:hypothetical protein
MCNASAVCGRAQHAGDGYRQVKLWVLGLLGGSVLKLFIHFSGVEGPFRARFDADAFD